MKKKEEIPLSDKLAWEEYTKNPKDIFDKELENKKIPKIIKRIKFDLHGYTLLEANEKVNEIINKCQKDGTKEILLITGKGLHSNTDNDAYVSKKLSKLKHDLYQIIYFKNYFIIMSKLTNCLLKKDPSCRPVWFMRQAGRYLPEFREIRQKNKDFIKLCLNSNLSSEITLQPIQRFNLDAAIIFSDILMVPYGLGQEVKFIKDEGPVLSPFNLEIFKKNNFDKFKDKLNPIYEAIKLTRENLDKQKSLIGFIGATWTLIVYMFGLKKNKEELNLNILKQKEEEIRETINLLIEYLCLHIELQFRAGAEVIQIFDSWAGLIPEAKLSDYCFEPNKKIVQFCKNNKIPVICFPRNLNKNYLKFADIVKPDCLSLDYKIDPIWAKENLKNYCLQGGMDPKILFEKEDIIFKEVDKYLTIFKDRPYIFNLGHGLLPQTNPDVLQKVIERVNNFK